MITYSGRKVRKCCVYILNVGIVSSQSACCSVCSGWRSAEPHSPAFLPLKRAESDHETPEVWPRPSASLGYPDKLSVRVGDLTHHPQVLRETRSHGSSRSSGPRQECPLCSKVCITPMGHQLS